MKAVMGEGMKSTLTRWSTRPLTNTALFMESGFRASRSGCPKLVTKMVYVPMEMQSIVPSSRNLLFNSVLSTTPQSDQ